MLSMSSRASADRAPRGLRFFFEPRQCHVDQFIFDIGKISDYYFFFFCISLVHRCDTPKGFDLLTRNIFLIRKLFQEVGLILTTVLKLNIQLSHELLHNIRPQRVLTLELNVNKTQQCFPF